MNKQEIKSILMAMRTQENEMIVNHLLGKIDMKEEFEIEQICLELGNSEENIKSFLAEKLTEKQHNKRDDKTPINDMFTYGISDNCIHLHLPVDLHENFSKQGISKTIALVNLYLLDAIDRIKGLKDNGFYKFQGKDTIYMISPVMVKREMRFLDELDFITHSYTKKQLNSEEFVERTPEAQLAVHIFGKNNNVGTASIGFNTIDSITWQDKKNRAVEELNGKGISILENKEK